MACIYYVCSVHIIVQPRHIVYFFRDSIVREQHEFEDDGVQVILEWDELSPLYSASIIITPETQVNISSSAARLIVAYNTTYNVTVVVSHLCDQSSETIFSEVYYYARECIHTCTVMHIPLSLTSTFALSGPYYYLWKSRSPDR